MPISVLVLTTAALTIRHFLQELRRAPVAIETSEGLRIVRCEDDDIAWRHDPSTLFP